MQAALPGCDFGKHAYTLERSRRRRRTVQLSLDPILGLRVSAPVRTPKREIDAFVQSKSKWIARALDEARERERLRERRAAQGVVSYLGRDVRLRVVESTHPIAAHVKLAGGLLEVSLSRGLAQSAPKVHQAVEDWLKAQAATTLLARVDRRSQQIGVQPRRLRVRGQRTLWGSCGMDGTLYFNWRIIMAPLEVLDYLVVHELCHLRRRGHGPAFWRLVSKVLPNYRELRDALRRDGWRYRLGEQAPHY